MPVITRYCDKCGVKIPTEDIEDGKAVSYLYLAYCHNCRSDVDKIVAASKEYKEFEGGHKKKSGFTRGFFKFIIIVAILAAGYFIGSAVSEKDVGGLAGKEARRLESDLKTVREKAETLQKENDTLKKDNKEYQSRADRLAIEVADLKRKGDRGTLLKEISNLKRQITELEQKQSDFIVEKGKLIEDKNELYREIADMKGKVEAANAKAYEAESLEKKLVLSDVQVVLLAWESAYNNGDHNALLACYSKDSDYRKDYKKNSYVTINNFQASTKGVRYRMTPSADKAQVVEDKVIIPVKIRVNPPGVEQSQKMTLIKESGKWLISKTED